MQNSEATLGTIVITPKGRQGRIIHTWYDFASVKHAWVRFTDTSNKGLFLVSALALADRPALVGCVGFRAGSDEQPCLNCGADYVPQEGVHIGRPPCAVCGANYHLHRQAQPMWCPEAYRPGTLQTAAAAMATAQGRHDPAATFAARGDLQRLLGRGHTWDGCIGCRALDPDHQEVT